MLSKIYNPLQYNYFTPNLKIKFWLVELKLITLNWFGHLPSASTKKSKYKNIISSV